MVDFAALRGPQAPAQDYPYTCDRCGRRQVMRIKLPDHLLTCIEPAPGRPGADCGGTLQPEPPEPREPAQ